MDNNRPKSVDADHSFLNSSRSFVDYFEDLAETGSADTNRLEKGKRTMMKIYHPDHKRARVLNGAARHGDIGIYEKKAEKINKASTLLADPEFRARHAKEVAENKVKRGGKEIYDQRRKDKLKQIQQEDKNILKRQRENK